MSLLNKFILIICCFCSTVGLTAQSLAINEFMADNDTLTQITDEANQYDDWIEIHNLTNQVIDLGGYNLSDNSNNLDKWTFPSGTMIAAAGYLIVWADDDASQGPLHATFKLSKNGESIYLTTAALAHVDSVQFGEQDTNISMARIPNGTGPFIQQAATFGFNNDGTMAVHTPANDAAFDVYPNPITTHCYINWTEVNQIDDLTLTIYDTQGKLIYTQAIKQTGTTTQIEIPMADWSQGNYFLHLSSSSYHANRTLIKTN